MKTLGADATLADRRKLLRTIAGEFHQDTSWGRKVWSKRVRHYLEQHGLPPLVPRVPTAIEQKMTASDITFPWRQT